MTFFVPYIFSNKDYFKVKSLENNSNTNYKIKKIKLKFEYLNGNIIN